MKVQNQLCYEKAQQKYDFDVELVDNDIMIDYHGLKFKIATYENLKKRNITSISKINFLSITIETFKKIKNKLEKNYLMYFFEQKVTIDENYIVNIMDVLYDLVSEKEKEPED